MMDKETEELRFILKALNSVKEDLGKEMMDKIKERIAGYYFYKEGVNIMSVRLGIRAKEAECQHLKK